MVSIQEKIYLFGGLGAENSIFSDIHEFDQNQNQWMDVSSQMTGEVPGARAFHGMTSLGRKLFVFGGSASADKSKSFHWTNELHGATIPIS